MFNNGGTNAYFRQCITFRPGGGETLSVLPQLSLSNLAASVASPLGTIPDGELGSWASLYSQTFLSKVIAKYTPAQTMGVSNQVSTSGETTFAASDAVMWTVPFYDNVDKFLSTSNTVVVDPDESGMSTVKVSPYARKHSIYRPWTRILRPSAFLFTNEYIGTGTLYHKRRSFMDFGGSSGSESSLDMNGLCIMMPALRRGGEANPSTTTPQFYPADGNIFVLGKLTFTYVQIFKTRQ